MVKNNKIALITGANSGIGLELTKKILSKGWEVAALNRSDFPGNDPLILQALKTRHLRIYKADLADFSSLRGALGHLKISESHIDLLFNNAGVYFNEYKYSKQKREMHFEMNTLVPYIILMELKELLVKGKIKTVINTSSNTLLVLKNLNLDTLMKPGATRFRKIIGPYAHSKLALSLWTKKIASDLWTEGIKLRSVCPGPSRTKLTTGKGLPLFMRPIRNLIFAPTSKGASRLYDAAFNFEDKATGIFINKGKETRIKFREHEELVLAKLNDIYNSEFVV
ncbi:SDR family NAD(P)-dependent oxidoreductase [Domibacillus robiginosus]|uniref:SDR family NAD(P)-dependent oxidoreductase n=1 Tax=Domibacillus robiginosus TaxID=1071054 RepID=UPI00067A821A|nr:SDR family NAD(P)-dependent oxidoreductase [Domibacillus robiginosus]